jgi:hypothetical protein
LHLAGTYQPPVQFKSAKIKLVTHLLRFQPSMNLLEEYR